jgi:peptide deformylase
MKTILKSSGFLLIIMLLPFFTVGWLISCQKNGDKVSNFSTEQIDLIMADASNQKMTLMNWFIQEDSLLLRKSSSNINFYNDKNIDHLISRMYATVTHPSHPGVGIAAPQVGILKRIIWVKRYDKPGSPFEVYLNTRITAQSDTLKLRPDGCLSIPGVSGQSYRFIWVEVQYNTRAGEKMTEKITHEYTAHIFQHEIDHLEGIVWLDRVNQAKQKDKVYIDDAPLDGLWLTEETN